MVPFSPAIVHEAVINITEQTLPQEGYRILDNHHLVDIEKRVHLPTLRSLAQHDLQTMSDESLDSNWKLHEFFGTITVINLTRATERRGKVTNELEQIGTPTDRFEFFTAIDGQLLDDAVWKKIRSNREFIDTRTAHGRREFERVRRGEAGCYLSHYRLICKMKEAFDNAVQELVQAEEAHDSHALKKARRNVRKYSRVLILEDDCGFGFVDKKKNTASRVGSGRVLRKALTQVPSDWDMLYFVVFPTESTKKIASNLYQIGNSWSAVSYAINHTMYDALVDHLKGIEDPLVNKVMPVDNAMSFIHHKHNVYAVYPSLAYHEKGKSQISSNPLKKKWQGQPLKK